MEKQKSQYRYRRALAISRLIVNVEKCNLMGKFVEPIWKNKTVNIDIDVR